MQSSTTGFNPEYSEDAPTLEQIQALEGAALLEFGTSWCSHCQAAQPAIAQAMQAHSKLLHIKVFDGKGKKLGRAFAVKQWPTMILLDNGKEVARLVRPLHASEVERLIKQ